MKTSVHSTGIISSALPNLVRLFFNQKIKTNLRFLKFSKILPHFVKRPYYTELSQISISLAIDGTVQNIFEACNLLFIDSYRTHWPKIKNVEVKRKIRKTKHTHTNMAYSPKPIQIKSILRESDLVLSKVASKVECFTTFGDFRKWTHSYR